MRYGAIDLHSMQSQVRSVTDTGEIVDRRIPTTRDQFTRLFPPDRPMRVLLEASTDSEWVAQCLEAGGHEVIVADPNYAPMYGHRSRRIKTDRRDVAALAEACRLGIYRPAHRASATQRAVRRHLHVRRQLVRTRTRAISLVRALLRGEGLRLPSGSAETVRTRLAALTLPPALEDACAPLVELLRHLDEALAGADRRVAELAAADPSVTRLMSVPGIGPVTATAFVATLDDVHRFRDAGQVTSFLGLVPREYSSGEHQHKGAITKTGDRHLRSLLVQAAWVVWRVPAPAAFELRVWARGVARRRGTRIAVVALARRLARILYAMWRDHQAYDPQRSPLSIRPARSARDAARVRAVVRMGRERVRPLGRSDGRLIDGATPLA